MKMIAPLVLVSSLLATGSLAAQSIRATGATSVRFVELRLLERDSIAADSTNGTALLRQLPDGRIVRCVPGEAFCRDTRPGEVVSALPVLQDLSISAWGFGRGLHAFAQVRGRETLAGAADLWPRSDHTLDLLALFAEMEGPRYRVRAGRQWKTSGLGFYNFDGVDVALSVSRQATIEAYAGRSLVRGLNGERTAGALESIESLSPPSAGVLFGLDARYRPSPRFAVSGLYQIDFRWDGRGIYSELAALNSALSSRHGSAETSVEVDVATGSLNHASLQVRTRPLRGLLPSAEVRRYRPYFELWTIWGAFSPIGFDEARTGLAWARRDARLIVRGEASYRSYEDPGADRAPDALRTDGWGAGVNLSWSIRPAWRFDSAYRVETGFGAARRDGHAALVRQIAPGSITLHALAFQRLYEFRLSEGTVFGLGAETALRLRADAQLFADATVYRHLGAGAHEGLDWNQRRASVRLQWTVGAEPKTTALAGAR